MAKFKIINSDQGHNYTHYVEAPDRQTAMDSFKVGHYGRIVDCEEVKPKYTPKTSNAEKIWILHELKKNLLYPSDPKPTAYNPLHLEFVIDDIIELIKTHYPT